MIKSDKHIDSLDGLRGIAILLVFVSHYCPRDLHNPLSYVARIGWAGVDLFFVLSGFLITGILYDTRGSGNFFKVFYARRTLRLLPVYFLAVCFVLVVATLTHSPKGWLQIPFFVYCANIVIAISGSIAAFPPYLVCGHFWSLSLEEQFYSFWPLVVFFVPARRSLIKICIGSFGAALLLRVVLIRLNVDPMGVIFMQLPTRMDSLLTGALLALVIRGPKREMWLRPVRLWMVLGVLNVCLLALIAGVGSPSMISVPMCTIGYSLLAGICLSLLALGLVPGTPVNRVGKNQILRFFGRYSYGLYLWHFLPNPVCSSWIPWFRERIHPRVLADLIYTLAMLALFTGISVLSYHIWEIRFLKLKSKFCYVPAKVYDAPKASTLP